MVHVYNCHPFSSQQIVQVEQEPGLVCCGGGALFVVATGRCKVEAYSVEQEGCPLICRFATMGTVKSIQHSKMGDYLVTIEEKNSATYLRAYTNWRYQAEEKARVGVRLLGHLLRGASVRSGVQMEIIEIPLSERPVAVACCSVTGDLLVGCENTLVLFTLRRQSQQSLQNQSQQTLQSPWPNTQQSSSQSQGQTSSSNQNVSVLDFERSVILHLPKIKPKQVALCDGYVAVRAELEVLVLKLDASSEPKTLEESSDTNKAHHVEDQTDFLVLPRHQELLGDRAKDCDIPVSIEKTGLEDRGQYELSYVLFRRFTPDFFQGCSVEETQLHSLQLYPLFTSNQSASLEEPACVFCFFSLPTAGYLYSMKGGVELLSAYQYPEKVLEAVLTDHLLHVITKNALQCFTVRCAAVAARIEDPYIDTTMKACPPCNLEVCALRMQLFIGLRSVCVYGRHVILLSTADTETPEETERNTQRRGLELKEHTMLTGIFLAVGIDPATMPALESLLSRPFLSRKWTISSPRETSTAGHGWNIYVVDTVSPLTLYQEMVEYSQRYAETNPQAQSLRHLLSEAHLLLRASLVQTSKQQQNGEGDPAVPLQTDAAEKRRAAQTDRQELEEALRQNCAQLGDCFSRNALQCFTVRCAAVAARIEDPYIDTTMKACPPCNLEVCALRMQLFIGLRSVCVYGRHVILLSTADTETPEETERNTQRRGLELKEHTMLTGIFLAVGIDPATMPALESLLSRPFLSRKWTISSPRETSTAGHGWNIYVVDTVSPLTLYQEMVEYSQRYAETNPQAQSLRHLLSEAHLLLRASLVQTSKQQQNGEGDPAVPLQTDAAEKRRAAQTDRQELEEALRQNCAQLGDCFSRGSQKDYHLTLPYYRMSGLSVTQVMARNRPLPSSPHSYGPGFLFYLTHYLLEETEQSLSQEAADEVIDIFSHSEPSHLVSVCASPPMINVSPARTLRILQHLEDTAGVSVPLTITMATMMLLLDDLPQYTQLMERHAEMLLMYGFIEEPRLLLHGGGGGQHAHIRPTALTRQLAISQPGLLVAAMVALHENSKVQLEQADHIFKELGCENCLQVDFWEAMLMASSQEAVIQELLFRLASLYIDRLTNPNSDTHPNPPHTPSRRRPLKSTDDLINSCSHYGALYPWLTVLSPAHTTSSQHQEALHKLQSLLCGPSLSVGSVGPLLERLSEETLWGFSLHLLCATRRGQYDSSIEKLLDRCPQAIIAYANHQLQDKNMALWWQKLLPELCNRTRAAADNSILLAALKETLVVVAMETSPTEFLELIPDDGTASYFLPHLLTCSQRHLLA